MAKTDVLARVDADLARGQTQPAIQRLSSLVAVHPTDLDLRRRLAAVHRQVGNRIEAGRWAYLDAGADPTEVEAFERAYPSPARRLDALRWRSPARLAATDFARRKLDELATAASISVPATAVPLTRGRLGVAAVLVAIAFVVISALVGAVTVIQWLF
jgi:hypothetical protein